MLIKRLVCIITVLLLIVNFLFLRSGFRYKHQVALNDHHLNIKTFLAPHQTHWMSFDEKLLGVTLFIFYFECRWRARRSRRFKLVRR